MKYLIFSDSHLNDFFDERKFNFLKRIILNSDRVIINGDFWEAYDLKINSFISSKWNKLFKYLKKNKLGLKIRFICLEIMTKKLMRRVKQVCFRLNKNIK